MVREKQGIAGMQLSVRYDARSFHFGKAVQSWKLSGPVESLKNIAKKSKWTPMKATKSKGCHEICLNLRDPKMWRYRRGLQTSAQKQFIALCHSYLPLHEGIRCTRRTYTRTIFYMNRLLPDAFQHNFIPTDNETWKKVVVIRTKIFIQI